MKTRYQDKNGGDIFDNEIRAGKGLNLSALPTANIRCRYCSKNQTGRRVAAEKGEILGEQLLTPTDVTKKLRISRAMFYRIRGKLIANGVKTIVIGENVKYLESSIDKLILKCAYEDKPLVIL